MTDPKAMAAATLYPMLDTFHAVDGQILRAVWRLYANGCLQNVTLDFGQLSLLVEADADLDIVNLRVEETAALEKTGRTDASESRTWKRFVGEPFGWGWVAVNQQGYFDSVLLSFSGISPQLMLIVEASSLKEKTVEALEPNS